MRVRILGAFALFSLFAGALADNDVPLLPEVRQHLSLARSCASSGRFNEAAAHAGVVSPARYLRVKIDCSNIDRPHQGIYRNALSGAFRMWQEALGEKVFEVTELGDADVVVHFQPDVSDRGIEVCGHSEWTRGVLHPESNPTVVLTADVQVRMYQPNGQALTIEQLRACAAHELGHVLGLNDTSIPGDVMGRMDFNHPVTEIKPGEITQLVDARREAGQIRQALLSH